MLFVLVAQWFWLRNSDSGQQGVLSSLQGIRKDAVKPANEEETQTLPGN